MKSKFHNYKNSVISLRKEGKTYNEIRAVLNVQIPKSTLSCWCKSTKLTEEQKERIGQIIKKNTEKSREAALIANRAKRKKYLKSVRNRVIYCDYLINDRNVAKIALSMLYLGEGSKNPKSCMSFGNSNPKIIKIFLHLLRYCYNIDESKFRCTLQCRADQDILKLENYWLQITKIPKPQFYKARIDKRTIGKPTKKVNYKGVCRIDYFSSDIRVELDQIIEVINKGL